MLLTESTGVFLKGKVRQTIESIPSAYSRRIQYLGKQPLSEWVCSHRFVSILFLHMRTDKNPLSQTRRYQSEFHRYPTSKFQSVHHQTSQRLNATGPAPAPGPLASVSHLLLPTATLTCFNSSSGVPLDGIKTNPASGAGSPVPMNSPLTSLAYRSRYSARVMGRKMTRRVTVPTLRKRR
jgi:hypothetical protein